jgi:hypothetical protein
MGGAGDATTLKLAPAAMVAVEAISIVMGADATVVPGSG